MWSYSCGLIFYKWLVEVRSPAACHLVHRKCAERQISRNRGFGPIWWWSNNMSHNHNENVYRAFWLGNMCISYVACTTMQRRPIRPRWLTGRRPQSKNTGISRCQKHFWGSRREDRSGLLMMMWECYIVSGNVWKLLYIFCQFCDAHKTKGKAIPAPRRAQRRLLFTTQSTLEPSTVIITSE